MIPHSPTPFAVALATAAALAAATACTSVSTARVTADDLYIGRGVEPLGAIQVDVTSAYLLFIPIPGVDLEDALRRELFARAELMGADKVADVQFHITPSGGIWTLRRLLGWRTARATGVAVRIHLDELEADPDAGD